MLLHVDPYVARTLSRNGDGAAAVERLGDILASAAVNGAEYRLILEQKDPPPVVRPTPPLYGHVFDDLKDQFSGGIANTRHGIPIWE